MRNILHTNAMTTPRIRKEIQKSVEGISKLAKHMALIANYGYQVQNLQQQNNHSKTYQK